MNNIYDDPTFFAAYTNMPRSRYGLSAAGEWPQMLALYPNLQNKAVLDLGCGYGWHCHAAVQMGADSVLGIDLSQRMIERAIRLHPHTRIQYRICNISEYEYPENTYDFVLSNLALHYMEDLEDIYTKVFQTLKPGGCFLFNIEHPVFTAGVRQEWVRDENGTPLHWPVDDYYDPGLRETVFLEQTVMKYHHTLTQIINPLLKLGFRLEALEEVMPPHSMMHLDGMADEMRRPMMLLVKAVKESQRHNDCNPTSKMVR